MGYLNTVLTKCIQFLAQCNDNRSTVVSRKPKRTYFVSSGEESLSKLGQLDSGTSEQTFVVDRHVSRGFTDGTGRVAATAAFWEHHGREFDRREPSGPREQIRH